jgi:hypothetical protein
MGTANAVVVSMRAFFDHIDAGVMDNIRSGEDHVLSAFDAAIEAVADASIASDLQEMRGEVTDLLHQTRDLDV